MDETKKKLLTVFLDIAKQIVCKNYNCNLEWANFFHKILLDQVNSLSADDEFLELVEILFCWKKYKLAISPYARPYEEVSFLRRYKLYRPLDKLIYNFLQSKGMIALYNLYQDNITLKFLTRINVVIHTLEIVSLTLQNEETIEFFENDLDYVSNSVIKHFNTFYHCLLERYFNSEDFEQIRHLCLTFVNNSFDDLKKILNEHHNVAIENDRPLGKKRKI